MAVRMLLGLKLFVRRISKGSECAGSDFACVRSLSLLGFGILHSNGCVLTRWPRMATG